MKIQVLRRKMSKIFFASIYEQKNVYYQVKNATFIGKSQFLSTLHSKSTFKSFQVFIPVTIRIWDLYRVKIWVSKPPWDPLGGANCHGKKELEPFRVPGEKQQFKVPAPSRSKVQWSRGFLLKTRLTYYLSLDSSVGRALGDKYDEKNVCEFESHPSHIIFFRVFSFSLFILHELKGVRGSNPG